MKNLIAIVLFTFIGAAGLWCAIAPASAIRFRRRMKWSESLWSGGYFYATELRARITGSFLAVVCFFAVARLIVLVDSA
jgi:hypothetical protein